MMVRMSDVRAAKMCSRGARDFFARHDLDWSAFLEAGVDHELLLATGDPMARQVVELVLKRAEVNDGRK